jgi:hypothetical protein
VTIASSGVELAAQLREAHTKLQLPQWDGDAPATATLVRHGSFEVRLVQPLRIPEGAPLFWMEMFDHDRKLSIDSVGNLALGEAVIAAEDFIARAIMISRNPHSWRQQA